MFYNDRDSHTGAVPAFNRASFQRVSPLHNSVGKGMDAVEGGRRGGGEGCVALIERSLGLGGIRKRQNVVGRELWIVAGRKLSAASSLCEVGYKLLVFFFESGGRLLRFK